jgi:hypothetical protein
MHKRDPEEVQLLYQQLAAAKRDLPLAFGWLQRLVDDLAAASWGPYSGSAAHWVRGARKLGLINDMMLYVHHVWSQTERIPDEGAVEHILPQLHVLRTLHYTTRYGSGFDGMAGPFMTEGLCVQFKRSIKPMGRTVKRSPSQSRPKAPSK